MPRNRIPLFSMAFTILILYSNVGKAPEMVNKVCSIPAGTALIIQLERKVRFTSDTAFVRFKYITS